MNQVLDSVPCKVTPAMNDLLKTEYKANGVKTTLFPMFPTKAPGPDGLPAHFFQRHWEVCGEEVTKAVLRIIEGTESAECINESMRKMQPDAAPSSA